MRLTGQRRGMWMDHATGEGGDVFDLLMVTEGVDFAGAIALARDMSGLKMRATPPHKTRERSAEDDRKIVEKVLWYADAQRVIHTNYLRSRGITIDAEDLLSHRSLRHVSGTLHPAMLGKVRNVAGDVTGLHRTYLSADARGKAAVEPNKMMLGRTLGCAVRLAPHSDVLGLCEGIETGLSVMMLFPGVPVWATLSTSGMRGVVLPDAVKEVAIFADNDQPGRDAANVLSVRLMSEGRRVRVVYPKDNYGDFNDELVQGKA